MRPSSSGSAAIGDGLVDITPPDAWTHLTVRNGKKGPVASEMVKRRVQTRIERKRTSPEDWLVFRVVP